MAQKPSAATEYITQAQAAEILGVTTKTVRARISQGHLPAYRMTGSNFIRLKKADVYHLMETRIITQ